MIEEMVSQSNSQQDYHIVLGNSFLRQFTTTFNLKDRTLALGISKYADTGTLVNPIPPDDPDFPPGPTPDPEKREE